jgi:DNA-directed RNA polymerase specialized sigma24 family protein
MHDYLPVTDLMARAGSGEKQAWDALVERYSPLIWSICRKHQLGDADARAVGQSIWRQLGHQLDRVQDPGALAGWLAAAAWRECGNLRPGPQAGVAQQERLAAESHATLRAAFSRLPPGCQRLLTLLIDEPSLPDTEISARLSIPVCGIGPTRRRCLDKLRHDPAIAALTSAGTAPGEGPGRAAR